MWFRKKRTRYLGALTSPPLGLKWWKPLSWLLSVFQIHSGHPLHLGHQLPSAHVRRVGVMGRGTGTLLVLDSPSTLISDWFMDALGRFGGPFWFLAQTDSLLWWTCGLDGKEYACNARDPGLIRGTGRSLAEGNGNPLQYSCLENSMDRGAWQAIVHGVSKSWTQLSN